MLYEALRFIIHFTSVITIVQSFLSSDRFCIILSSRLASNRSSVYGIPIQSVYQRFCGKNYTLHNREGWNLFHYLGGNGPWIEKSNARFGTYEMEGKPPEGCVVDQVHMLSRHAERYPTKNAGARHLALLSRLESYTLNGSLSFLNNGDWTYFTPPTFPSFENLTTTSPYAGTLSAFTLGTKLRTRYPHLLPSPSSTQPQDTPINFWSASTPRDIETALYFADGLFGRDWSGSGTSPNSTVLPTARLHIIPEHLSQGGNTLTPGRSCPNYITDEIRGRDKGYSKLAEWQAVFSKPIAERLSAENPGLTDPSAPASSSGFTPVEIYSMMEMCGFEILARGFDSDFELRPGSNFSSEFSSPWCGLFTRSEWEDFAYARDLLHFYRAGPGNQFSGVMGSLWLDAVSRLLVQDSKATKDGGGSGEIYASFAHDGDIVLVLAALGVFDEGDNEDGAGGEEQVLPTDHVKRERNWRTGDLVPMTGRIIIERLNCRTPHGWRYRDVRLWINDGWVGWVVDGRTAEEKKRLKRERRVYIPQMEVGRFRDTVKGMKEKFGRFGEVCGLPGGMEESIKFLHQ
ncbi:hypothetical protein GJ744_003226 [Endocarpon pusillum]|uniref:3-phytase n=1 Tax=Endocarpon pusillum TaxID=364733 RepID=A0A8H7AB36_9EURO|nr:hypothetical protein GJ744_003226 [Endocarpon pusillum]